VILGISDWSRYGGTSSGLAMSLHFNNLNVVLKSLRVIQTNVHTIKLRGY
jgi:hypothetical protein